MSLCEHVTLEDPQICVLGLPPFFVFETGSHTAQTSRVAKTDWDHHTQLHLLTWVCFCPKVLGLDRWSRVDIRGDWTLKAETSGRQLSHVG